MALMNLSFKLNGGKEITLTYQEAELLFKDLEKVFGGKTITYPPPQLIYPPGVREIPRTPGTWCGGPAIAHGTTYWGGEVQTQKEALAEIKLSGEAH